MKKVSTILTFLALLSWTVVPAQRYLEEVFDDVEVTTNVTYGVNATVLYYSVLNEAVPEELKMDIYEPAGDTETNRPLILYFHTGNFLPHPQNQSPTGLRTDSAAVELCTRFAKMGYVVASCDYRLGWNPIAPTQDERVYTLINAAYRGVQDCRTAIRYFRMTEDMQGNPYGIDPDRVVVWGQGTGGYISFASASIDTYDDIVIPKFIQEIDVNGTLIPVPMVLEEVNGDIYGTSYGINPGADLEDPADNDTLCYPNHVGYSSDFSVAVNMGGACGDISWVDPEDVPMISFHIPTDPFAPYGTGTVIVPGLNLPVVEVMGSYDVQATLSNYGNNDVFELAELYLPGLPYTEAANANNDGYHGLFPFVRPEGMETDSAPWEWWADTNPNNTNGLATNPDMSADKGRTFIDTIQWYAAPRIACALNLEASPCYVGIGEADEIAFNVFPNPTNGDQFFVRSESLITRVCVFNMMGQVVFDRQNINTRLFNAEEAGLSRGIYLVEIATENGTATRKLVVE